LGLKPLIGVPCHGDSAAVPPRYVLYRSYVDCLRHAGAAVVAIPACTDPELLRPIYGTLAGLLLAGGGDVRPERYGQGDAGNLISVDPERDETEFLLARWAMEDDLPILAICRGIQVLNVALGGDLVQDIPSQVPGALIHNPGPGQARGQVQHPVTLVLNSRLATIVGQGQPRAQLEVNSFHHQCVRQPAPSLRVVARAPDGIIEGLECADRTFVLGVQWHPEELAPVEPPHQAIFHAFVASCAARRTRGQ
jgi:putative glutamine amidotransferase